MDRGIYLISCLPDGHTYNGQTAVNKIKALALYSGGLDSILACRIVMQQDVEVKALHFITPFFGYDKKGREKEVVDHAAAYYGISLEIIDVSHDYLTIVKQPRYGYGKHLNPCVDCKIFLFSTAKAYLEKEGASFLITGEVLGQRPMSQRRDTLRIIERDSDTSGLLLRPLSARHLPPTIPEERGWLERDKLLDFRGRGRTPQMTLAARLGIAGYPSPAGGCLLTDKTVAARIRWLFAHIPDTDVGDLSLATVGRHFTLSDSTRLVVGRSKEENERLVRLSRRGDVHLELADRPGPLSIVRGPHTLELLSHAASITARYSKARGRTAVPVTCRTVGGSTAHRLCVDPLSDHSLEEFRIA